MHKLQKIPSKYNPANTVLKSQISIKFNIQAYHSFISPCIFYRYSSFR